MAAANIIAGIYLLLIRHNKLVLAQLRLNRVGVSAGSSANTCEVVAAVNIPGQNLNNAGAVTFAGLYYHGGCVPVPQCPYRYSEWTTYTADTDKLWSLPFLSVVTMIKIVQMFYPLAVSLPMLQGGLATHHRPFVIQIMRMVRMLQLARIVQV